MTKTCELICKILARYQEIRNLNGELEDLLWGLRLFCGLAVCTSSRQAERTGADGQGCSTVFWRELLKGVLQLGKRKG